MGYYHEMMSSARSLREVTGEVQVLSRRRRLPQFLYAVQGKVACVEHIHATRHL